MQSTCSCSGRTSLMPGHLVNHLRSQHAVRRLHTGSMAHEGVPAQHVVSQRSLTSCKARIRQSAVCNWQPSSEAQQKEQTLIARSSERLEWGSAAALWSFLIGCGPALADVGAKYDPSQGSESVKNIAGVFYAGLLAIFAFRLLTRRAKKFREERIASLPAEEQVAASRQESEKVVTPLNALWSAVKLGVLACLLFQLSSGVDGYFEGQPLPDQLTARNITITLRTVVRGLSYLMTFLFAANTVGLTALTVQLLINPEAEYEPKIVKTTEAVEDVTQGGSDHPS